VSSATAPASSPASSPAASDKTPARPEQLDDIPGWFFANDRLLFDWFLGDHQREVHGDPLELGAYLGKSATLLGRHLRPDEILTVCDLFDSDAADDANSAEMAGFYRSTLTRVNFEQNYLAFHDRLPEIIQAPTSVLADGRIPAGSCRFVHVDASHLYEHVAGDIQVARKALAPDGVIVLDDYRAEHTPEVAAAAWEAVFQHGLHPICLSSQKFYGTWGDPEPAVSALRAVVGTWPGRHTIDTTIAGESFVRLGGNGEPPAFPASRFHSPSVLRPTIRTAQEKAPASPRRPRLRRVAADLLPPLVVRAVKRRRRRSS
jgi:hypothetical protein